MSSVKRGTLNISHGRVFQARVIDVVKSRCSVRLTNNGQVLRGLAYGGGPLQAGDICQVSYESGTPMVMAIGRTQDAASVRNPIKNRVAVPDLASKPLTGDLGGAGGVEHGHFYILQIGSGGAVKAAWPADAGGLSAALAAAVSGDLVTLPIGLQVTDNLTIPDGVNLTGVEWGRAQITGQVTCLGTSYLKHLDVIFIGDLDGDTAVRSMGADSFVQLTQCEIQITAPEGATCNAFGLEGTNAKAQMWRCYLHSGYGDGIARALYFSLSGTQELSFLASVVYAMDIANDYTALYTYASQLPPGSNYGTPLYGDRAAENHTHAMVPHNDTHEEGGSDEIDVTGLSGLLADPQDAGSIGGSAIDLTDLADGDGLIYDQAQNKWLPGSAGGATSLDDLTDVQIEGTPGWPQTLVFDELLGLWFNYWLSHDDLDGLDVAPPAKHLTAIQKTDLTGGGATTLHKHDHGGQDGLGDDDHTQYHNDVRGDARYAPVAKGVTNGDTHNHNGGDGAQIDHGGLSGLTDDDHTQYVKADGSRPFTDSVLINDTANTKSTVGLTVNQGANDDEIISLKSSDVNHGVLITETDTYCYMSKYHATQGGANFAGFSSGTVGMVFTGVGTTGDTNKSATADGYFALRGLKKSGSSVGDSSANENIITFKTRMGGAVRTIAIIDAEGDLHLDATSNINVWDEHDDIALLAGLRAAVLNDPAEALGERWQEWLDYARPILEKTGVVTFNDDGHHFVSMKRLDMLLIDAIRQLAGKVELLQAQLARLGTGND